MLSFVSFLRYLEGRNPLKGNAPPAENRLPNPLPLPRATTAAGWAAFPLRPWFSFIPPIKTFDACNFCFELSLLLSAITL
jgi:hypothetical protein